MTRSIEIRSEEEIAAGASWEALISPRWFTGNQDLRVDLSVETAAYFTLERTTPMSSSDCAAYSRGQVQRPGLFLRLRNTSTEPRRVRGWAIVTPNVDVLRRDIEHAAERAWSDGGDPAVDSAPETFERDLARALAKKKETLS